jgi:hypothetical protein
MRSYTTIVHAYLGYFTELLLELIISLGDVHVRGSR